MISGQIYWWGAMALWVWMMYNYLEAEVPVKWCDVLVMFVICLLWPALLVLAIGFIIGEVIERVGGR
jgi:hypothetical protein